jgi:hypothetical protein
VGTAIELTVAILLPTAAGYAVLAVVGAGRRVAERGRVSAEQPVDELCADLRRLHAQLDATENAVDLFAKNLRRNAVRAAYIDALCTACRRAGVPPPVSGIGEVVPLTEIYRAEAALREHGLDVRGGAGPLTPRS